MEELKKGQGKNSENVVNDLSKRHEEQLLTLQDDVRKLVKNYEEELKTREDKIALLDKQAKESKSKDNVTSEIVVKESSKSNNNEIYYASIALLLYQRTNRLSNLKTLFNNFSKAALVNLDFYYQENGLPKCFKFKKCVHGLIFLIRLINMANKTRDKAIDNMQFIKTENFKKPSEYFHQDEIQFKSTLNSFYNQPDRIQLVGHIFDAFKNDFEQNDIKTGQHNFLFTKCLQFFSDSRSEYRPLVQDLVMQIEKDDETLSEHDKLKLQASSPINKNEKLADSNEIKIMNSYKPNFQFGYDSSVELPPITSFDTQPKSSLLGSSSFQPNGELSGLSNFGSTEKVNLKLAMRPPTPPVLSSNQKSQYSGPSNINQMSCSSNDFTQINKDLLERNVDNKEILGSEERSSQRDNLNKNLSDSSNKLQKQRDLRNELKEYFTNNISIQGNDKSNYVGDDFGHKKNDVDIVNRANSDQHLIHNQKNDISPEEKVLLANIEKGAYQEPILTTFNGKENNFETFVTNDTGDNYNCQFQSNLPRPKSSYHPHNDQLSNLIPENSRYTFRKDPSAPSIHKQIVNNTKMTTETFNPIENVHSSSQRLESSNENIHPSSSSNTKNIFNTQNFDYNPQISLRQEKYGVSGDTSTKTPDNIQTKLDNYMNKYNNKYGDQENSNSKSKTDSIPMYSRDIHNKDYLVTTPNYNNNQQPIMIMDRPISALTGLSSVDQNRVGDYDRRNLSLGYSLDEPRGTDGGSLGKYGNDKGNLMSTIECYEKRFGDLNHVLTNIHSQLKEKDDKINVLEDYIKGNKVPSDLFASNVD